MITDKEKISLKQALFLYLTLVYTPSVRLVAAVAAKNAKQAAWLVPLASLVILILHIWMIQSMYKKHENQPFCYILNITLSKYIGKIVCFLYITWLSILLGLYIRYYAERLVTSVSPSISIILFIVIMLVLVAYTLSSGIVVIARMNQIFVVILSAIFFLLVILLIPEIKIKYLTPLSYREIVPVLKGSLALSGLWVYIFFLFMIGDKIAEKDQLLKQGIKAGIFLFFITICLITTAVGTLGYEIMQRAPLTFYATVKQISVVDVFERIESILISTWIISDFIIIAVFAFIILELIKSLLNLNHMKSFINIYIIFQAILSLYLCRNVFELQEFSSKMGLQLNVIFGLVIPIAIFIIGKIRKKI